MYLVKSSCSAENGKELTLQSSFSSQTLDMMEQGSSGKKTLSRPSLRSVRLEGKQSQDHWLSKWCFPQYKLELQEMYVCFFLISLSCLRCSLFSPGDDFQWWENVSTSLQRKRYGVPDSVTCCIDLTDAAAKCVLHFTVQVAAIYVFFFAIKFLFVINVILILYILGHKSNSFYNVSSI